jgi:hypothetical protein
VVLLSPKYNLRGGAPTKEYHLTLDAAKHFAMMGRMTRDYPPELALETLQAIFFPKTGLDTSGGCGFKSHRQLHES